MSGSCVCQISQNDILLINFKNFTYILTVTLKFDIYFPRLPWGIVFCVIQLQITEIISMKNVKECGIVKKIILAQGFCPLKIKIIQFSDGFRLNMLYVQNKLIHFLQCASEAIFW